MKPTTTQETPTLSVQERASAIIGATNHIGKLHADGSPNNCSESNVAHMTLALRVMVRAYKAALANTASAH